MPPQQCPECGRFLKNALVEGLTAAPAPCPKCGIELTAEMFGLADADGPPAVPVGLTDPLVTDPGVTGPGSPDVAPATSAGDDTPLEAVAIAAAPVRTSNGATPVAPSIRPPDLAPEAVRDRDDPLAGWDVGVPLPEVRDRRPFPTDTVLVAAGAVGGAVAGSLTIDRRGRGATLGALAGVGAVALIRRIWLLPDA